MHWFGSLRGSFASLGLVALMGTLFLDGIALWVQQRLDAAANAAFVGKDVVADILPPPMYLIEARLVLSQAVEGTLTPSEAATQFQRLTTEYQARVQHWTANPPYGLEKQLLGE